MNAINAIAGNGSRRRLQFSMWAMLVVFAMASCLLAVMRRGGLHPVLIGGYLAVVISAALAAVLLSGRGRRLVVGGTVILFACMTVCLLLLPPSLHYRMFGDERSFNYVLSQQVQPGDSLADVRSLLGQGEMPGGADRLRLLTATVEFADRWPEQYPDGIESDDEFVGFRAGGVVTYLHFRSGLLVNYNPQDFEQPLTMGGLTR